MLAVVAAGLGVLLASGRSSDATRREDVVDVSREFALALSAYDYHDLDAVAARVEAIATGSFREEYETTFAAPQARDALTSSESVATATVTLGPFVASLGDDDGRTFTVVEQTVTSNQTAEPVVRRVRVELLLVETADGWRIDSVRLT